MARDGAVYVCQSCGGAHAKWSGQCSACGAWNTLVEEVSARPPGALGVSYTHLTLPTNAQGQSSVVAALFPKDTRL